MSKISEYLKLIPKAFNNFDNIVQGIINDVKLNNNSLDEDEKEEIIKRRIICMSCPFNSMNAVKSQEYKELYNENYKSDRTDLHCSICACNIHWKTAALDEQCGLSYFNDINPENKQELKWNKFNKNV